MRWGRSSKRQRCSSTTRYTTSSCGTSSSDRGQFPIQLSDDRGAEGCAPFQFSRDILLSLLGVCGLGADSVQRAQGVDEGGAGVHGHGNAKGFGDLFLGGAG